MLIQPPKELTLTYILFASKSKWKVKNRLHYFKYAYIPVLLISKQEGFGGGQEFTCCVIPAHSRIRTQIKVYIKTNSG